MLTPFESDIRRRRRVLTSGAGVCLRPLRPGQRDTGGIAAVSRATGIAASTIGRGLAELDDPTPLEPDRVRRRGGGRKSLTETDPQLLQDLESLVVPDERGDPMSPLRWTCKSLRQLARELRDMGHQISHTVVGELLKSPKFSLQANRKTCKGTDHPDCFPSSP